MTIYEKKVSEGVTILTKIVKPYHVVVPMWKCARCGNWLRDDVKQERVFNSAVCPPCFECFQETKQ